LNDFTQHENDELRQAVEGLAQSVLILQQEAQQQEALQEKNSSRKGKLTFAEGEHFVTAPNTPSMVDPLSDERRRRDEQDLLSLRYDADGSELVGRLAPITPKPINCLNDVHIEGTLQVTHT
jgi:hypothetical protein